MSSALQERQTTSAPKAPAYDPSSREAKWQALGTPFTLHDTPSPSPSPEEVAAARAVFAAHGLRAV
ncbi:MULTISPECIES: hypothetical protein [unclassified Streptomyces]|uniref:Uncharacterized protein n=1 Tax=Streptomyces sp. NBC_00060 TaxID=2975636 RepID=A0AAU2H3C1_9ACTN